MKTKLWKAVICVLWSLFALSIFSIILFLFFDVSLWAKFGDDGVRDFLRFCGLMLAHFFCLVAAPIGHGLINEEMKNKSE